MFLSQLLRPSLLTLSLPFPGGVSEPTLVLRLSLGESARCSLSQTDIAGWGSGPQPHSPNFLSLLSLYWEGTRPFLPHGCSTVQSPHPPFISPSVKALLTLPACVTLIPPLQEDMAPVMLAPQGPITKGLGMLAQAQSWC